jgi:hypothetical protein
MSGPNVKRFLSACIHRRWWHCAVRQGEIQNVARCRPTLSRAREHEGAGCRGWGFAAANLVGMITR